MKGSVNTCWLRNKITRKDYAVVGETCRNRGVGEMKVVFRDEKIENVKTVQK